MNGPARFPMWARVLVLGAASGMAWWALSLLLGGRAYGILGSRPATGAIAGACTGLVLATISAAVYRLPARRTLLWYSPLSVYLAIGLYGLVVYAIRWSTQDFLPGQRPWAVGLQS